MGSGSVGGKAILHQQRIVAAVGKEISCRPRNRVQRDPFDVKKLHGERVEVQRFFPPAQKTDDGDAPVRADDIDGGAISRPRIGGEYYQVNALTVGKSIEIGLEFGIAREKSGMGPHLQCHFQANRAVGQSHHPGAKESAESHRSQP